MTNTTPRASIKLRIERPTRAPGATTPNVEKIMLDCAASALNEAIDNGVPLKPTLKKLTQEEVRQFQYEIAGDAWKTDNLVGEGPLKKLHTEHGGWGPPVSEAPEVPWRVLAVDVLGFMSFAMGQDDVLVWEEAAK